MTCIAPAFNCTKCNQVLGKELRKLRSYPHPLVCDCGKDNSDEFRVWFLDSLTKATEE